MLAVIGEVWCRFYLPYQGYPWGLCSLVDPRCGHAEKTQLAAEFISSTQELDRGFSQRLKVYADVENLLPGGRFHAAIDALSMTKVYNVQVETNFARAAAMRRCGAGAALSQATLFVFRRKKVLPVELGQQARAR